jgi:hypothetical protein
MGRQLWTTKRKGNGGGGYFKCHLFTGLQELKNSTKIFTQNIRQRVEPETRGKRYSRAKLLSRACYSYWWAGWVCGSKKMRPLMDPLPNMQTIHPWLWSNGGVIPARETEERREKLTWVPLCNCPRPEPGHPPREVGVWKLELWHDSWHKSGAGGGGIVRWWAVSR